MNTTTATDPLVDALAIRAVRIDLVGWQRIAACAEQFELSFEHLRVLLALKTEDGRPSAVSELAELAGVSLRTAYPAIDKLRRRGFLREERRRYVPTRRGEDLIATLEGAHRDGIKAYVDHLDPDERRRLEDAFGIAR
jgi:DNA-binding MarR family transcriptional regulator